MTPLFALLSGCYSGASIPAQSSPANFPAPDSIASQPSRAYVIGPFDKLQVIVLGVKDLGRESEVNANGDFSMPLIGFVRAAGKTPDQVASDITLQLGTRYLRNPQVTVNVLETKSQLVTVDGAVREPGVFPVTGRMTLMGAVALAKGTNEDAQLDEIAVFRTINSQRQAAVFSLKKIYRGAQPDPEIFGSDIIIVGSANNRRLFRDLITTLPLVAIFRPFG
ncbi:polysaccharide biosynthesis/export family protein [Sphingomonas psychrotolerans]|uniref:polysaccharide biosynthesis/export family protein n=1 Tax=Sphingomonas psychrotolerans TaxID=1327635 RepID=UPI001F2C645D|nr:polysaccharide biosynthesis/export family protein [Sphingomonas psychrotolerans]